MLSTNLLLAVALGYVALLFGVAWAADRMARAGRGGLLRSPLVYTLSISVYCTSWTFFGAVGSAARSGLEFAAIYLGPTLVFVGWWAFLRKLVRIGQAHRITSIADMISSRYGKSPALAVVATLIAVVATTPYIALQLQSVTRSFEAITGHQDEATAAFWVAAGMAVFTILFGTRTIDARERHHGVVAAIALEAVVKLAALIAVGAFALWSVGGGPEALFARPEAALLVAGESFGARWTALVLLSAAAIICLPRQFQVTVVENVDERHLRTASWLFPLYLLLLSLFVPPIAAAGLSALPAGSNPDLFVVALPLALGRHDLALLAFIGGFSAATSMVIVAAIALSTMLSNHVVGPLALRLLMAGRGASGDMRALLLGARRVSIAIILGLGFLYFRANGGSEALAAIGLIAFVGAAQFLPALAGGMFWRGATRAGALAGLVAGALLWLYVMFLPSFDGDLLLSRETLERGPWGVAMLRPEALFGLAGLDPLIHAMVVSLGANVALFVGVSLATRPNALERLQAALFVDVFRTPREEPQGVARPEAAAEDLFALAQRILGDERARRLFAGLARAQGAAGALPRADERMVARVERELAGSIGAASAHAMVSRVAGGGAVSMTELISIADETQRLIETSARLADKTRELERTAAALRRANDRLRELDRRKDDFLSQVSHELRTPMTSVRSFCEILLAEPEIDRAQLRRFLEIIHDESLRLTRLLDEILDVNRLEAGAGEMALQPVDIEAAVRSAIGAVSSLAAGSRAEIAPPAPMGGRRAMAHPDRLRQVLINLLSNAIRHNQSPEPRVRVEWSEQGDALRLDVIDNGGGVSRDEAEEVFSKFSRGKRSAETQGAGLGLPISRAIMRRMGGDVTLVFAADDTSFFRVELKRAAPAAEAAAE